MRPLVSVFMVTYNHEKFVEKAIKSILAQETNFDFDIIIGEDCSTDRTRAICEELKNSDSRIKLLLSTKNLGLHNNVLRTLKECTGNYIAFCEGDDFWTDPSKLQKQIDFLEKNKDFSGCAHQSKVLVNNKEISFFRIGVPNIITLDDLLGGRQFHTASLVCRNSFIEKFLNAPKVLSDDRLINFCIASEGKIYFLNESMCIYRRHSEGLSEKVTFDQIRSDLDSIEFLQKIHHNFPKYRYKSYIYTTMALSRGVSKIQKLQYLSLAAILSFSYFPNNIKFLLKGITFKWR